MYKKKMGYISTQIPKKKTIFSSNLGQFKVESTEIYILFSDRRGIVRPYDPPPHLCPCKKVIIHFIFNFQWSGVILFVHLEYIAFPQYAALLLG